MSKILNCRPNEEALREALTEARSHARQGIKCEIRLGAGLCTLTAPLVLDAGDTGLTISGAKSNDGTDAVETVISGGIVLTDWQKVNGGPLVEAAVPAGVEPRVLIAPAPMPGRPAFLPRARYPENGTLNNIDHPDIQWMSSQFGGWNRKPTDYELTHMAISRQDAAALPPFEVENAEVTVFHQWDESTVRVKTLDRERGIMEFRSTMEHPAGAWRNEYVFWNIMAGLTQSGQWMFDRKHSRILYYPYPEETVIPAFRIPALPSLFRLEAGANHVTIRELAFELANAPSGTPGLRAVNPPGAVDASEVSSLTLDGLRITNCAGQGIRAYRCPDLRIEDCRISDCGAGGILTLESMPSLIRNNTVKNIGRCCYSAVSITAGGKSELVYVLDGRVPEHGSAVVENNRIDGSPYCGIVCCGNEHIIRDNRISQVMQVLRDGAAIYVSRGYRCRVSGNKIFDVIMPENCRAHALYFDERSWESVAEDNLVMNCASPFHAHKSYDLVCRNNRFFSNSAMWLQGPMSEKILFEHNTVVSLKKISFVGPLNCFVDRNNYEFSATDELVTEVYNNDFRFFIDNGILVFRKIDKSETQ